MTGDDMAARSLLSGPAPERSSSTRIPRRRRCSALCACVEQGFEVSIARNVAQARRELETKDIEVVVSEIDSEEPDAGLTLRPTR